MRYFLDTSLIINFLNKQVEATEIITQIARQEDSELFINRLVYLESLRTIPLQNCKIFRDSKAVFELFTVVDITQEIYDKAIAFSRFCKSKGISIKGRCESIDFLHFITAKHYALEMLADDRDITQTLPNAYEQWQQALINL